MTTQMTTQPRVLLIDDDVDLATMLAQYLTQESFSVQMAHDGESGAQAALTGEFNILVLDVMLPRKNGVEVLCQIRSSGAPTSQVPVLMLTARGDDIARIVGLELGADDYVPKPCTPRKLVAHFDRSIDVHVSAIRQKLGERADGTSWIQTVRGMGYQLT